MNIRTVATLGASALVMGMTMVGCATTKGPLARVEERAGKLEAKAADAAEDARKALARGRHADAVSFAEAAVASDPDHAGHRALLGKAYLSAGRFQSASDALGDALTLTPGDGASALNLALAQTALGDWDAARATLAANEGSIAPADRGLALALAGDPMGGVALLGEAARDPQAPAKVRQNLALGLALAGKWQEAKAVAAIDLPPADVDKRIMQWSTFARPARPSDQVAALLGVTPVADAGQPVQLALNAPVAADIAVADAGAPTPIVLPAEATPAVAEAAVAPPVMFAKAAPAPATMVTRSVRIRFADAREVVQALPDHYVAYAARRPTPTVAKAPARAAARVGTASREPAHGDYFVQLGAYDSPAVARAAWGRMAGRVPGLGKLTPRGMTAETPAGTFYRLSVGGFARGDAQRLCGQVKARGGACFVRTGAGEQAARWVRGQQVASR